MAMDEVSADLDEARDLARQASAPACDVCGERPAHVIINSVATCYECTPHAEEAKPVEAGFVYTVDEHGVVSRG